MSDTDAAARPRQLTLAAGFVIGGSVVLVLSVFEGLSRLYSVDMRNAVTTWLSSPTGEGLGISVDRVISLFRIGFNVAGVCAAAAAVLGVYVLRRHRGARVALSVLAVPILLTAPLTDGFVGAAVAAAIAMLWSGPARDWFAGRPVRESTGLFERVAPERREAPREEHRPPAPAAPQTREGAEPEERDAPPALSTDTHSTAPRPSSGYGEAPVGHPVPETPSPPPGAWPGEPPESWHPQGAPRPGWPAQPAYPPPARAVPLAVKIACLLTWVFSTAFLAVLVSSMVRVARNSSDYLAEVEQTQAMERAGFSPDALVPLLWAGSAMLAGWALAAMLLAWFVWRRQDWARYLLAVSAAAVFVAGAVAFPFGLPLQIACAVTIWCLFRGYAREWFAPGRAGRGQHEGGPPVW